ncbi:hypothetical protein BVRB_1g016880 [Beta vulgaris subsp. vulgaris]|nr:hypothetical protein BVRB_1g016880 [Beta vulgaris subsp. vulgaris]
MEKLQKIIQNLRWPLVRPVQANPCVLAGRVEISCPGPNCEIDGLGWLVHRMKRLGPHRSATDFHGSGSASCSLWA